MVTKIDRLCLKEELPIEVSSPAVKVAHRGLGPALRSGPPPNTRGKHLPSIFLHSRLRTEDLSVEFRQMLVLFGLLTGFAALLSGIYYAAAIFGAA